MTILSALVLYAGGKKSCDDCGRHFAYGQFLAISKPRATTVPKKHNGDLKAFSAPLNNALLTRYAADDYSLLHIEQSNKRKAWSILLIREGGKTHEIERMMGSAKSVLQHLAFRFGIKDAAKR